MNTAARTATWRNRCFMFLLPDRGFGTDAVLEEKRKMKTGFPVIFEIKFEKRPARPMDAQ